MKKNARERSVVFICMPILCASEMKMGHREDGEIENIRVCGIVDYVKDIHWQLQPFDKEDEPSSLLVLLSSVFFKPRRWPFGFVHNEAN